MVNRFYGLEINTLIFSNMRESMKHILQVPAHLFTGGVEKVAKDIGMYADRDKYQVDYIVFDKEKGDYEPDLLAHGCRVFRLQEPSYDYGKFIRELTQIMSETQYDIVHAHTMFNIGWIMMVAKRMGIPVRVAHAHSALKNNKGLKKKCYELVMRHLIIKYATDFVACGEKAGIRLYGERIYKQKGNLILNGIDIGSFRFNSANRNKIRSQLEIKNRFVIGHAGHLAAVKNQKYLIELMPEILKQRPDAILLLLGDGSDKQMLKDLIGKKKLQNYVIMTGNVSNVHEYLSAMDVFAFPSLFEGMPLSILEAQANGLPCILSTGVPKDVRLTDLVVPLKLNDKTTWINMICKAKRAYPEKYSEILYQLGVDVNSAMKKIYAIYERTI